MISLRHIDCFSGVGGIATGFHAAGIHTVLAIEKIKSCIDTYTANHPNIKVINQDIREVNSKVILEIIDPSIDLITAGMPCETFSTAGNTSRSFYDNRQTLFTEAIRIAKISNARMILFENVPGFANKKLEKNSKKLVIDLLREQLTKNGYSNRLEVKLNAKDYGVPQSRERLFILATKDPNIKLTPPIANKKIVTVSEAFLDLELVDTTGLYESEKFKDNTNDFCSLMMNSNYWKLKESNLCTYHRSPKHRAHTIKRFKMIRTGEGLKSLFDRLPLSEIKKLQSQRILPKKWYIQRNRRLDSNKTSPTVTSHCLDELLHPVLHRSITIREAARLQSFPNSYEFVGGPDLCPHFYEEQDKYEQIGDAVPPLMAFAWAKHIKKLLA